MPAIKRLKPKNFRKLSCSQCLDGAVLGFDFSMAFQPIVDIASKQIFAQEALVRGLAGEPASTVFESVNEENLYRFDQNCRVKAIEIGSKFVSDSLISINFMPRAVYKPELCIRTTLEAAEVFGFDPKRIMFEFNEAERVSDISHLKEIIEAYKQMGFKTAIDDFGSGYSGLNQLTEFKPDYLKLDMQLIRGIDSSFTRNSIVKSIVWLCAELGIGVIAEGIETQDEKRALLDLGITQQQGYLYAKPEFERLIGLDEIFHLS
ncbi:MAG TPA: EAL domain-containing protein [Marinobacterium sp.]|nr:EAL domain-containing protein [Marinobacterium sp.]